MKELYIDCSMGLAGDMLSAALLELCPDKAEMLKRLNSIGIPGIEYSADLVDRYSVTGTHMKVTYLGQQEEACCQDHIDEAHHHRSINDIYIIIDTLDISDGVKHDAKGIYRLLAESEAKVHGCNMDNIHFHELGTMDAVADICAVCYIVHELRIDRIMASPVCTGFGKVLCAHGIMPIPAPATALLLIGMRNFGGDVKGELCTPTGVAIVKYFAVSYGQPCDMTTLAVGYGMGNKDFGGLSCVRAILGTS